MLVMDRCKQGDTCLKKVLRVKNMYLENKKEFGNGDCLNHYADLKLNVQMDYRGKSMIVEIQFLMSFMVNFKRGCHRLYEISRLEEFTSEINDSLSVTSGDKQRELMFLIHVADTSANVRQLAKFLMSFMQEIDLEKMDKTGMNCFHRICKIGNLRMLKLLMSLLPKKKLIRCLTMECEMKRQNANCFHIACRNKHSEMVKYFVQLCCNPEWKDYININMTTTQGSSVIKIAAATADWETREAIFDERLEYGKEINLLLDGYSYHDKDFYEKDNELECKSFQLFKRIMKMPHIDGLQVVQRYII